MNIRDTIAWLKAEYLEDIERYKPCEEATHISEPIDELESRTIARHCRITQLIEYTQDLALRLVETDGAESNAG